LGTLRLNCNWDYDKVHDMANSHNKIREMLGHSNEQYLSNCWKASAFQSR